MRNHTIKKKQQTHENQQKIHTNTYENKKKINHTHTPSYRKL